jgi:hypothetical protein
MSKKRLLITIGIVVVVVALTILFDTLLANHLPAITILEAEPERVLPSGSCQIVCNTKDRDGDQLSYNWSASGGEIHGEGDTVTWMAPRSEGSYNITVIVTDGRGGEVMDYVIIEVRANRPPAITNLVADADWTTPSGIIWVTCTASDRDGDELNYEWSTDGGNISGTGAVVNWTAPAEVGIYNITVVVTDGHGSSDTKKLCSTVVMGEPPNIESLLVTAEHCYLREYSWGYKVGKAQEYQIECTVTDGNSELVYDWACEDGTISGGGSVITWNAPDEYLKTTEVTVTVTDIADNMVCKNVVFEVVSCSRCTFGC